MTKTATAAILSDDVWRRHANKWSVITRYSAVPLIIASIWSRLWLSWWCVLPLALTIAWIWLNPRFPGSGLDQ